MRGTAYLDKAVDGRALLFLFIKLFHGGLAFYTVLSQLPMPRPPSFTHLGTNWMALPVPYPYQNSTIEDTP